MRSLPPLDCLRFFEVAARHESFTKAAEELCRTQSAVAYRVKTLEAYLGYPLFTRQPRGVRLTSDGRAYLKHIQRIFADLHHVTQHDRSRRGHTLLKVVAVEVVAEQWLMPRLAHFKAGHPEIAIELETDHCKVDPRRRDFDIWIAFTDTVADGLDAETLFTETLLPVCSPALQAARGRLKKPGNLRSWPLLYDLEWSAYWAHWFASHGEPPPDLSTASGFRLYSMMIQAAINGMGVALGHASMIARELERGQLVALSKTPIAAPARYILVTAPDAGSRPEVQVFRNWIMDQVAKQRSLA